MKIKNKLKKQLLVLLAILAVTGPATLMNAQISFQFMPATAKYQLCQFLW
jgi:hypothetical protein